MKRKSIYLAAILGAATLIVATIAWRKIQTPNAKAESAPATKTIEAGIISAPGRVEPVSEEIEVGAEISGKIREVRVEEGDRVARGQILAVLENADYKAQVAAAEADIQNYTAQIDSAKARLMGAESESRRVINGARTEERREALAAVAQAEATARNAVVELDRRRQLYRDGDIPREELDRAKRDADVASARAEELKQRAAFVSAEAREEDRTRAQSNTVLARAQIGEAVAQLARARARLAEARAVLDKTIVCAPLSGTVLRKRMRAGESFSIEARDAAKGSIFTLADTTALRVRVDVDERDVGRLRIGQNAYVTAEGYGDRRFTGHVIRVGQVMGKKNVRTEEPTERVDTKILETLVELDVNQELPTGLRVDAFISVGLLASNR